MIRYAAAVAIALCLNPSSLCAQSVQLTVTTASAEVHKFPSIASPVIGKAPKGTSLPVVRAVGDWVRVSWPGGEEGVGYVRLTAGTIAGGPASTSNRNAALTPSRPTTASASTTTVAQAPRATTVREPSPATLVTPQTHFIAVGARIGSQLTNASFGFGAGARAWSRGPLGVQLDVSRYSMSDALMGRVTSTQFAPSVLYAFRDHVTDYLWMRPYVGAGMNIYHSALSGVAPDFSQPVSLSNNGVGFQGFGGGEMTFASAPRFTLSADVGYHSSKTPFTGFKLGGAVVTVSGHYYFK